MNNPENKQLIIQLKEMDLEKLKNLLELVGIKSQQISNTTKEENNQILQNDEEDILEPISTDSLEEEQKSAETITAQEIAENNNLAADNEIMPEDIINDHDSVEESDLESDNNEPDSTNSVNRLPLQPILPKIPQLNSPPTQKTEILKLENKITINVGGKRFHLKKNLLEKFNINYGRLPKIVKDDGRVFYFLDKDPYYFSKIIDIVKLFGFEEDKILENLENFSDQMISELCFYGIIDKKYSPKPKLKLKRMVSFPSRHDEIVKIIVGEQIFETSSGILSKSAYFDSKLKISRTKKFYLSDIDPKIFRYVLNFLRTGELYLANDEIIDLLNNYGIEYEFVQNKRINDFIVSHHLPHNLESVQNQLIGTNSVLDPRANNMSQFIDNKYYQPQNMYTSPNTECINVLTTDSPLVFGSEIVFNLTDPTKNLGECIEDMLLCIDIPVLKSTEPYKYVDMIEYKIVEHINLVVIIQDEKKIILQTNQDILYMYPLVYHQNAEPYHRMCRMDDKKVKLLFNDQLIEINRIILPLFLLKDKQNHIPVQKMANNRISASLVVKIAPLKKLFLNKIKEIPLLNVSIIANFINLASSIPSITNKNIIQTPINTELKTQPIQYMYEKTHQIIVSIQTTPNAIYNVATIPLDKFGYIKDFFFTIIGKDDYTSNKINRFMDELIELEILQLKINTETGHRSLLLHSKLDSTLLNYYLPLKLLGHVLPAGVYYYSFSADPKKSQFLGGLLGYGYALRIKVKKMDGYIKFYTNEYVLTEF